MVNALIDPKKKEQVRDALRKGDFEKIFGKKEPEKPAQKPLAAEKHAGILPGKMGNEELDALLLIAVDGDRSAVERLLKAGADVNARYTNGCTALMEAARGGQTEIVDLLVNAKADVNATDSNGRTALMGAAVNGQPGPAFVLVSAGANVDVKDKRGKTALDYADCEDGVEIAAMLRRVGAKKGDELP